MCVGFVFILYPRPFQGKKLKFEIRKTTKKISDNTNDTTIKKTLWSSGFEQKIKIDDVVVSATLVVTSRKTRFTFLYCISK